MREHDQDIELHPMKASKKRGDEVVAIELNEATDVVPLSLWSAVQKGNARVVRQFLENGANVNEPRSDGTSLLYIAALFEHADIVEMLLEKGADVNGTDNVGNTALSAVVKRGNEKIVYLLLERGADVNGGAIPPLRVAVNNGNINLIRILLENGANINQPNNLVCVAVGRGDVDTVRLLLAKGANANQGVGLMTPLYEAARKGHVEILRVLVEAGVGVTKMAVNAAQRVCGADSDIVQLLKRTYVKQTKKACTLVLAFGKHQFGFFRWVPKDIRQAIGCFVLDAARRNINSGPSAR